ncbi:MAG: NosD domain-containing protein [Euryarchaeota archaeon]|nr:NosD domain-containing protein [Euryarchaeota archaeon]
MTIKSEGTMIPGKLKWYAILALALWLAFSGVAAAEQLYVNESGWWRDGGAFNTSTAPIQAAVDAAAAGDAIYVYGGSYTENVDVDTPLITLEGVGADVVIVTAADSDDHVFEVTADRVNLSCFTVTGATDNWKAGIRLRNANYCNISKNNVSNNRNGILMDSCSDNNMLESNTASNNGCHGIYQYSSDNNTFRNNTANSNSEYGINLWDSSNNTLTNNKMSGNNHNFGIHGYRLPHYLQNIDTSNKVDEAPVYFWVDRQNQQIPDDAGYVGIVNSTNITVRDLALTNNGEGVLFAYTKNSMIENITTSNNWRGIKLWGSSNNTLTNNTANSNNYYGIHVGGHSDSNMLVNNNASENDWGIYLEHSSNNVLHSNTANSNNYYGIRIGYSNNNTITCNWMQNNIEQGIYLYGGSSNNNISYNNIIKNGVLQGGGSYHWQFYNSQSNPVEAKHNYWGAGMNNETIDASTYDDEEGWGEVGFYPFETKPAPCAMTPEESRTFTTTDAVIALQIAAGSRPPDLRWDVSGDKRVTLLDALMISQAAAHAIDL